MKLIFALTGSIKGERGEEGVSGREWKAVGERRFLSGPH